MGEPVNIPGAAVDPAGKDIAGPTAELLRALSLLPTEEDLKKAKDKNFLTKAVGPSPDSLAVIESSATAITKWWAGGIGAAAVSAIPIVRSFWEDQPHATRRVLVVGVSVAIAAAVLAIAQIIASDVRGRAAATVAAVEARAKVAEAMLRLAESAYSPDKSSATPDQLLALPAPVPVRWRTKQGPDEAGWRAMALATAGGKTKFLVVKGTEQEWTNGSEVDFEHVEPPRAARRAPANNKPAKEAARRK